MICLGIHKHLIINYKQEWLGASTGVIWDPISETCLKAQKLKPQQRVMGLSVNRDNSSLSCKERGTFKGRWRRNLVRKSLPWLALPLRRELTRILMRIRIQMTLKSHRISNRKDFLWVKAVLRSVRISIWRIWVISNRVWKWRMSTLIQGHSQILEISLSRSIQ